MKEKLKKPLYKKWWVWLIAVIFIGMIGSALEESEDASTPPSTEVVNNKVEPDEPEEVQLTEEELAAIAAEEEEKTFNENKKKYHEEIRPQITDLLAVYDNVWSELWGKTLENYGVSISRVDAYKNIIKVEDTYSNLWSNFGNIDVPKNFPKEDKEQLKSFKNEIRDAALNRQSAARKMAEAIDTNDASPSKMTSIENHIKSSDSYLFSAVLAITFLDTKYEYEQDSAE